MAESPTLCACGCGRPTTVNRRGRHSRYLRGHAGRAQPVGSACLVEVCDRPVDSNGYCRAHREWIRRNPGQPPTHAIASRDPEARFLAKVTKLRSGHWIWTGATASENRYGAFQYEGRVQPAHRVAWQLWRGPLNGDEDVDHTCRKTLCVNPDHLEPVPHRENVLRGDAPSALNAAKTHCKRGHEFTPGNTRLTSTGGRACIACEKSPEGRAARREATRRYRERKRAEAAA